MWLDVPIWDDYFPSPLPDNTHSSCKIQPRVPPWAFIIVKMEHGSIMEPSFPVIAVHKGWLGTPKGRGAESRTSVPDDPGSKTKQNETGARPARRQFEFVNSSTGKREKNPNVTRLIKSQARKNPVLDKRRKIDSTAGELGLASNWVDAQVSLETVSREKSDLEAYALNLSDVFTAWQFSGSSTAWCTWEYPIDMRPRTHRLLEMYLIYVTSRMYPEHLLLRTNPLISSTWFRYAVTDAAMLHAMLYSGGLYLALLEGRTETNDTIYHLNKTISIVNNRLKSSPHSVQDATIGAITCLALGGVRILTPIMREYSADSTVGYCRKPEHMAHPYAGFETDHREKR